MGAAIIWHSGYNAVCERWLFCYFTKEICKVCISSFHCWGNGGPPFTMSDDLIKRARKGFGAWVPLCGMLEFTPLGFHEGRSSVCSFL